MIFGNHFVEKPLKNHPLEVAKKRVETYSSCSAAAQNPEERVKIIKIAHDKKKTDRETDRPRMATGRPSSVCDL